LTILKLIVVYRIVTHLTLVLVARNVLPKAHKNARGGIMAIRFQAKKIGIPYGIQVIAASIQCT